MAKSREEIRAYNRARYAQKIQDPIWKAKRRAIQYAARKKRLTEPAYREAQNKKARERQQCNRERAARLVVKSRFDHGEGMPLRPPAPALLEKSIDAKFRELSATREIREPREARRFR